MARIVCMANSWREGGRCIAGIDLDTGRWVRPAPRGGGPIADDNTRINGKPLRPLDVVEIRLRRPAFVTRFQKENLEVADWRWRMLGRMDVNKLMRYSSRKRTVLHNGAKIVEPAYLERLPERQWTSLELVHVRDARFERNARAGDRWDAEFSRHPRGPTYRIKVTDPAATKRLNDGERLGRECLLTVSLTEPVAFPQYGRPLLCYKLVAGIIEVTQGPKTEN